MDGDTAVGDEQSAPSLGKMVHYRLSSGDVEEYGAQLNGLNTGDSVVAFIVRVWSPANPQYVNLRVLPDGTREMFWKTSIAQGPEPGRWHWPGA